jgi:predicted nucleotidyltransferase
MTHHQAPPTLDELRAKREAILRVAAGHHATHVRVFGSVARGEADAASDVDLLVDLPADDLGGFAYFGALEDLRRSFEHLLGCKVDIVDSAALRRMRDRVLAEAVDL